MKRLLFILGFFLILKANAQTTDSSFTLQQCIDYALSNDRNIMNAELDKEIAESKVKETRAIGYPRIMGSASLVDNPQLPRMFFSPTNPFLSGSGSGGGNPGTFTVKKSGDIYVVPNIFQLRSSGDMNAQLTQLIFDGSYVVGLQASSAYRELSQKGLIQTKITTVENVTQAYYTILITEESLKMFDINLRRLDTMLYEMRASYKQGLVEDIDVKRMEVQYNNLLTDKQNSEKLLLIGKLNLKLSMGMPLDQEITLADSLNSFSIDPAPLPPSSFSPTQRIEYSMLQTQEKLSMLDLKRYRYSRLPTISAFAKGGLSRSDLRVLNLFKNEWFPYSMVGLSLSVPILDFTRHYQIQQAKYSSQQVKNTMYTMENALTLESTNAQLAYNNSMQAMQNQKRNMELAQEVVRVSRIKYREGVGSNLEVVNAEADLQNAQINYYRALYDAMVARVAYQKATGTLYNGQ